MLRFRLGDWFWCFLSCQFLKVLLYYASEGNMSFVKMGNKCCSPILGIGNIYVFTNIKVKLTLKDMRLFLISTSIYSLLASLMNISWFDKGNWKLTKCALIQAKKGSDALCKIQWHLEKGEISTVEETSMDFWRKWLDHMSKKGVQALARRKLLSTIKGRNLSYCDRCLIGKQNRIAFVKNANRRKTYSDAVSYTHLTLPTIYSV